MTTDRFLTFTPYQGGMSNCRMNLECVAALAHATDRTLVIPETPYAHPIEPVEHGKKFRPMHPRHFMSLPERSIPIHEMPDGLPTVEIPPFPVGQTVIAAPRARQPVPAGFRGHRQVIAFDDSAPVLHVPQVLEPFYAWIWDDGPGRLAAYIREECHYPYNVVEFGIEIAAELGDFDAVLVRRAEAISYYPQTNIPAEKIAEKLAQHVPQHRTLVIETDERDKAWFLPLTSRWNCVFLRDLMLRKAPIGWHQPWIAAAEQVVCAHAETFVGTRLSTFSSYVDRLRGHLWPDHAETLHTDGLWESGTDSGGSDFSWEHYMRAFQPPWAREFKEGWSCG